jgi:hypothetical protein
MALEVAIFLVVVAVFTALAVQTLSRIGSAPEQSFACRQPPAIRY